MDGRRTRSARSVRSGGGLRGPAEMLRRIVALNALVLLAVPSLALGQDVLELARRRHGQPDTALTDYTSRLNTLVSVGLVTDPLAPPQLVVASELASGIAWDRRHGLQIRMLGQRYVSSFAVRGDVNLGLDFSEPWFVATTPGDSLRILGSIELPSRAAVHPFAAGAERYYSYEIGDSLTLLTPGRRVDLIEIRVTPTRGDEALVVGSIWVDAATGDVGAMQIRFVGRPLWADHDNPQGSAWANRILSVSASVEQGLWEQRFWLPYRQELVLMVRIPFIGNLAIPLTFRSDFGRYAVNSGSPIAWLSPDSLRAPVEPEDGEAQATITVSLGKQAVETETRESDVDIGSTGHDEAEVRAGSWGGGWEIIRPSSDSLNSYDGWSRPLEAPTTRLTLPSAESLERRARQLSNDIVGRRLFSIQYDRLPELIRYNRVEALGLGLAARWDIPRRAFWSLGGAIGFGLADLEPKGRLSARYDAPGERVDLAGYSELHVAASTLSDDKRAFGNALRAFFLGRDDADYYRASGAALTAGLWRGRVRGRAAVGVEDHASVRRHTQVAIPGIWDDSVFQPNPPAEEGTYWRGDLETTLFLGDWTRPSHRGELRLGAEAGTGSSFDYLQPRVTIKARLDLGRHAAMALRSRAGWTAGDVPAQRAWRLGGLETVRGYQHGVRQGDSYWTARLELTYRRPVLRPVAFADFGWAGDVEDWPSGSGRNDVIWSAGGGVSFLNGLFRSDLVFPESGGPWLELYFAGDL